MSNLSQWSVKIDEDDFKRCHLENAENIEFLYMNKGKVILRVDNMDYVFQLDTNDLRYKMSYCYDRSLGDE